jgi:hypothetical protein
MESSIRESEYVILVCTTNYARRVNAGKGGVAYEKSIVTGEMFAGAPPSKFIPVLRQGPVKDALPSYLGSKYHIDFTNNSDYGQKLEELLRHLHQKPKYQRPELGSNPFTHDKRQIRTTQTIKDLQEGNEVKREDKRNTEIIECAYCEGSGNDPNSTTLTTMKCYVCHGNGQNRIAVGSIKCAHCKGSGRDPNSTMFTTMRCSNCKGIGRVYV